MVVAASVVAEAPASAAAAAGSVQRWRGFLGGDGGFGGGGGEGGKENEGGKGGVPGFGGGTAVGGAGSGAGMGGAVFNMQGTLLIENSTLAGNHAVSGEDKVEANRGKGIAGAVFNLSGSFTATDSTFAGNSAADDASQIFNLVYDANTPRTARTTLRDTIVANGVGPFDLASNMTAQINRRRISAARSPTSPNSIWCAHRRRRKAERS